VATLKPTSKEAVDHVSVGLSCMRAPISARGQPASWARTADLVMTPPKISTDFVKGMTDDGARNI
jgi:hypothetical protein